MNLQKSPSVQNLNEHSANSAASNCGILVTAIGDRWVKATMPIDARTCGSDGSVRLGALAILAESVGSLASTISVDSTLFVCLGQSLQVYHLAIASAGPVVATASPVDVQPERHIWQIDIVDANGVSISSAKLTTVVLPNEGLLQRQ